MSQLTIETYSDIYKNSIAELILNIQNKEFAIPISLQEQPDLLNVPEFYQVGNGNFWIAKFHDRVVGTIALLDIGDSRGALRKMFVEKNFRGRKFGTGLMLLNQLLRWAKEKKLTEIYLGTTEKFIAAHRFYEKYGFKEIRKQELPAEFPVMAVDVKFYSLLLLNIK